MKSHHHRTAAPWARLCLLNTVWLSGCYTLEQGYHQANLLRSASPLEEVIKNGNESPERLEKLRLVPRIMEFAKSLQLTPGGSYRKYIALDRPYVTWTVQAAEKRRLQLKTWWFPFVGDQPYLGYFSKTKAANKQKALVDDGLDTIMGGVRAFSLLGYFDDPLYSSMLDGVSTPSFVETLFHESVHATIYIPNFPTFNENLADFIGRQATIHFLKRNPDLGADPVDLRERYAKQLQAQKAFRAFLVKAHKDMNTFYENLNKREPPPNDDEWEQLRSERFNQLADDYANHMADLAQGTSYQGAFQKGRINNAVILSYSLYEAMQEPFSQSFERNKHNLKEWIVAVKQCIKSSKKQTEADLFDAVKNCGENTNE